MAGWDGPGNGAGWRVFVSHTSELRDFPAVRSYVAAVERAIAACGHVIVDMADFPAADQPAAELCRQRVRRCQVYVGVLGTRYGSPVRDEPQVSYTELEFEAATEAGLDRLVFLLDTDAADVGIPPSSLIDHEFGARQEAFRRRVQDSGLITQKFTDPATLGQLVERSLRELAEASRRRGGGQGGLVPAVVGDIPQEPLGFQPRADLLAALDTPGPGPRVVHALTGMRGVGKTHLAAAYARAKLAERWRLVAWVNAEDLGGVMAGLDQVAAALGLDTGDVQAAGRAVRHRLETDGERCLLVFDNATDPDLLRPFIPAAGTARVIITSNQQSVAYLGAGVPVDVFSEQEALSFLSQRTGRSDEAGARELVGELGFLPLALAQAAAVIAAQHLDYPTYLARLRTVPVQVVLRRATGEPYRHSVAEAIVLALDAAADGDQTGLCRGLMNVVALLSAAGVSRALLYAAGKAGLLQPPGTDAAAGPESIDEALGQLASASLLTFSVDGSTVAAHRLTMRVARERQAKDGSLAALGADVAGLLSVVTQSLAEPWQNRPAARDAVQQIMALHEHLTPYLTKQDAAVTETLLRLRRWAVLYLNDVGGSFAQAIEYGQDLVADCERVLGDTHPDTLTSRYHLARAYRNDGRLDEAIPLFERTLADREELLGDTHPDTLKSRNSLGYAYRTAGQLDEAIPLLERTLAARERVLGDTHPDTLKSRNHLTAGYRAAGQLDEAIPLLERTLADREQLLGDTHPETLISRNSLAATYRAAGRLDEAIPLFERTIADRERVLGDTHPRQPEVPRPPRSHLPGGRAAGRGHPAVRAHPRRPRAGPG